MYSVKCITNENDVKIVKEAYKEMAKGHCRKCNEWNEPCNVVHMGLCGKNLIYLINFVVCYDNIFFIWLTGKHELPLSIQAYNLLQKANEAKRNRNSGRMDMPNIMLYISLVFFLINKLIF